MTSAEAVAFIKLIFSQMRLYFNTLTSLTFLSGNVGGFFIVVLICGFFLTSFVHSAKD